MEVPVCKADAALQQRPGGVLTLSVRAKRLTAKQAEFSSGAARIACLNVSNATACARARVQAGPGATSEAPVGRSGPGGAGAFTPRRRNQATWICAAAAGGEKAPASANTDGRACPGFVLTVEKKLEWFEGWSERSREAAAKAQSAASQASRAFNEQHSEAEELRRKADEAHAAHKEAAAKTDWRARLQAGRVASAAEKAAVKAEKKSAKLEEAMVEACMQAQAAEYTFEASRSAIIPLKKIIIGREALALTESFDERSALEKPERPSAMRIDRQSRSSEQMPSFRNGRSSEWLAESRERAKELGREMEELLAEMRQMQEAGTSHSSGHHLDEDEELDVILCEQFEKLEAVAVNSEEAAKELSAELQKLTGEMAALELVASESLAASQGLEDALQELRQLPNGDPEVPLAVDTLQMELQAISKRTEDAAQDAQRLDSVFSNVREALKESMELCCAARGLLAQMDPPPSRTSSNHKGCAENGTSGEADGGQSRQEVAPGTVVVAGKPPLAALEIDPLQSKDAKEKRQGQGRSLSGYSP